jgi:hypothetical protein
MSSNEPVDFLEARTLREGLVVRGGWWWSVDGTTQGDDEADRVAYVQGVQDREGLMLDELCELTEWTR